MTPINIDSNSAEIANHGGKAVRAHNALKKVTCCLARRQRVVPGIAAYVRIWHQKKPSAISFAVRKTRAWNPVTGEFEQTPRRRADGKLLRTVQRRAPSTGGLTHSPSFYFTN